MDIPCVICDKTISAVKVTGKDIHPHRAEFYDLVFYLCPHCENYVGTHKDSGKPLGCIVSQDVKDFRLKIHALIDPLYRKGLITKKTLYKRMAEKLNIKSFHTSNIRTIEEAREVYKCGLLIKKELKK